MTEGNTLRLLVFLTIIGALVAIEQFLPDRSPSTPKQGRWVVNISLFLISSILGRLTLASLPIMVASYVQSHNLGLLGLLELKDLTAILVSYILLDLTIYFQHLVFHHCPLLWRFHKVHHSDINLDATTGFRFHPGEIILSLIIKIGAVYCIGAPPEGVLLFEILLNSGSLFNHANIRISKTLEKSLRWFIVTPRMHQVHHSIIPEETNTNFSFTISIWDRIFGTYYPEPRAGFDMLQIGLAEFRKGQHLTLGRMLCLPFNFNCRRYADRLIHTKSEQSGKDNN